MKVSGNDLIKPGHYAIIRGGSVAMAGKMPGMSDHYQPGDILVLSISDFEMLRELEALSEPTPSDAQGRSGGSARSGGST